MLRQISFNQSQGWYHVEQQRIGIMYSFRLILGCKQFEQILRSNQMLRQISFNQSQGWYHVVQQRIGIMYSFRLILGQAIECYDKSLSINPKDDAAWSNKGQALSIHLDLFWVVNNLNKYQEAIECFDKSLSINPKNDVAWSNKGYSLIIYQNNILLHKLQKYKDAIQCYDEALSININPLRLQRKADSLKLLDKIFKIFELGKKSEAKQFYLAALEKGSTEKNYIQKQLQKL